MECQIISKVTKYIYFSQHPLVATDNNSGKRSKSTFLQTNGLFFPFSRNFSFVFNINFLPPCGIRLLKYSLIYKTKVHLLLLCSQRLRDLHVFLSVGQKKTIYFS